MKAQGLLNGAISSEAPGLQPSQHLRNKDVATSIP
jgi:hypothetical protein